MKHLKNDIISRAALLEIAEEAGHVTVDDILAAPTVEVSFIIHKAWVENNFLCITYEYDGEKKDVKLPV